MNNKPNKLQIARADLLAIMIFTLVNVLLLILGSGTYFLFSASIPYAFAYQGVLEAANNPSDATAYVIAGIILAVVLLVPYFVAWLVSKKHPKILIMAIICFALDTLFLVIFFDISSIVDLILHIYFLITLIREIKE